MEGMEFCLVATVHPKLTLNVGVFEMQIRELHF